MSLRPVLRYFGGKARLTPRICELFPPHDCYVEPFGGGGSVIQGKRPAEYDYYNDLDLGVVTLFRVLRERPGDLVRAVEATPFSRAELGAARGWKVVEAEPKGAAEQLEVARRVLVWHWQGRGGGHESTTGWRFQRKRARCKSSIRDWLTLPDRLLEAVERWREIYIEHGDALECIRRYDSDRTLTYADPPYLAATRSKSTVRYRCEMADEERHRELAAALLAVDGMVVLSHPRCDLYEDLYAGGGWERVDFPAIDGAANRTVESVWLNPRAALGRPQAKLPLGSPNEDVAERVPC